MLAIAEVSAPINTALWAIEGVPAADAAVPWRRVWALLSRAVARFPAAARPWTSDGVLYEVMCGHAQLWIAWSYERRRIDGVVISRLFDNPVHAPGRRVMECPLVAGEHMAGWGTGMFGLLTAWARSQGCDCIVGYGRRGWKRLFGFAERGRTADGLPILVHPVGDATIIGGQMRADSRSKDTARARPGGRKAVRARQLARGRSRAAAATAPGG